MTLIASSRAMVRAFVLLLCALVGSPAAAQELPVFSGKGHVTQALDTDAGGVLDIGSGVTMTFPKGLPIGHSRLVTLKKASKKPSGAEVHAGFSPLGTALDFSVPLNAPDAPIVLALAMKSDPRKKSDRLVLAMEIGTLCTAENKSRKLKSGLCSGWELMDADYDAGGKRIVAKLRSTGGMRMVFGLLRE